MTETTFALVLNGTVVRGTVIVVVVRRAARFTGIVVVLGEESLKLDSLRHRLALECRLLLHFVQQLVVLVHILAPDNVIQMGNERTLHNNKLRDHPPKTFQPN